MERDLHIVRSLPEVRPSDTVVLTESGWTSRVYVVDNGRLVVKFPRASQVRVEYQHEEEIFCLLKTTRFEVDLPRIRYVHDDYNFIVLDGIEGNDFSTVAAELTQAELRGIGKSIGEFLKVLHALDVPNTQHTTIEEELDEYQEKYRLGLPAYQERLTFGEQARLRWLMEERLPARVHELGSDLVFSHGDLGYWNVILESDGRIGVVDFGDAGYWDRSKDFLGLEDAELLDAALRVYGDDPTLRDKIEIRQRALPVIDLPFYIGKHDDEGLASTLARLRERL